MKRIAAIVLVALMTLSVCAFTVNADEAGELEQELAGWGEPIDGTLGKGYRIDFESDDVDDALGEISSMEGTWIAGNATDSYTTKVAELNGNKFLQFNPFSRMYLESGLPEKYVFSFDVWSGMEQGFGIFFRSTGEETINPYFEDDHSGFDIKGIGPSGIYIIPHGEQIRVYVKFYDPEKSADADGKYLNNTMFTFDIGCDLTRGFHTVTVADDGTGAKIFVEGKLACTFKFENIVDSYEELNSFCRFFSKVTLFDREGAEAGVVENALVNADDSVLAIGMRINDARIDNIAIDEYPYTILNAEIAKLPRTEYTVGERFDGSGSAIRVEYENGRSKDIAITAEMLEGFDTSSAGEKEVSVNYRGFTGSFTVNVSEKTEEANTPAPSDTAATASNGATPGKADPSGSKNGVKPVTVVLIVIGALVIIGAALAGVLAKKKNKTK